MEIFIAVLLFILGLALIIKCGDLFVDAAAWIAEVSGIPKFIVGATVVSFATTLPEVIVSVIAALDGKADMAVGNAVGSVTANLGLIMAVCAVALPFSIKRIDYAPKGLLMVAAVLVLYTFCLGGSLSTSGLVILLVIFATFIYENIQSAKKNQDKSERVKPGKKAVSVNILKFIGGCAGIVVGADLLVENGSIIANAMGVPEGIVAVTLVAVGTSLPELVTMIMSIKKKHGALSVGNIIGANIIDTAIIVPLCGLVSGKPLTISSQGLALDLPVCLFVSAIAILPMLLWGKLMRWQGVGLLSCYLAYIIVLFV
ncbi:MAG: calcium/sodium antiporter [Oscillospiraceae bacterium]|nr:calcium/sodium antiporter [Oscillospiraceae bacterium]